MEPKDELTEEINENKILTLQKPEEVSPVNKEEEPKEEQKEEKEEKEEQKESDTNILSGDNTVDVEINPVVTGNVVNVQLCSSNPFSFLFNLFKRKNE